MRKRERGTEIALDSDRLADEKRIEAVLTEWGIESAAIGRIVKEHRARQARAQSLQSVSVKVCPLAASSASYINSSGSRTA